MMQVIKFHQLLVEAGQILEEVLQRVHGSSAVLHIAVQKSALVKYLVLLIFLVQTVMVQVGEVLGKLEDLGQTRDDSLVVHRLDELVGQQAVGEREHSQLVGFLAEGF